MAEQQQRTGGGEGRGRVAVTATVIGTEWLTPHMIRVTLGGDELANFYDNGFTDRYVKLVFKQPGVEYPEPFHLPTIRAELPREQWPTTRTYTVRWFDPERQELAIDFVYHGDEGLAGPWAAAARPGDELLFSGPGGAYAPRPEADWHLLVGDESALPAIGAALEVLPADSTAYAFIEVADTAEEQQLQAPDQAGIVWVHRESSPNEPGEDLVRAVQEFGFPAGAVHAFVHGEAGFVQRLRRHLLGERGIDKDMLSISGYWRRGKNEDGWQAEKAELARREREEQERAQRLSTRRTA